MTTKTYNKVMSEVNDGKYEVEFWMSVRGTTARVEVRRPNGKRQMYEVTNVPQSFVDQHNAMRS